MYLQDVYLNINISELHLTDDWWAFTISGDVAAAAITGAAEEVAADVGDLSLARQPEDAKTTNK